MGTKRIGNFRKSWSDRSVSTWASPIIVMPKKTAPGEPPKWRLCIDYKAIISLLPPVKKAFSKAKGVLTLVTLPKIDEIYACLKRFQDLFYF